MSDFLEGYLAEILRECGIDPALIAVASQKQAQGLYRSKLVEPARVFIVHRRIRMYELRSKLTIQELAVRFNVCPALVKRDIRAELLRLRAG